LMLTLHGNAGNAQEFASRYRWFTTQGWLLAVPQSSQVIAPNQYVWDEREKVIHEIQTHFATLASKYPLDPLHTLLGGFSKGGGMAVYLALSGIIKARGFIVM